jgi:hypothetical protein
MGSAGRHLTDRIPFRPDCPSKNFETAAPKPATGNNLRVPEKMF